MSPLALVKNGRNPEILRIIESDNYTLRGLENQFGVSLHLLKKYYGAKSHGRGRPRHPRPFVEPKKPTKPPKKKAQDQAPPKISDASLAQEQPDPKKSDSSQPVPRKWGLIPLALAVGAVGLGLSIASAALDWSFCRTLSQDPINSKIFGWIGVLSGVATMLTPSVAFGLRIVGQRGLAILLGGAAVLFFLSSIVVSISFSSTNIGTAIAANDKIDEKIAYLRDAFAAKDAARKLITVKDGTAVLEQRVAIARGRVPIPSLRSSNDCINADVSFSPCREMIELRAAEQEAIRRDRLDAELADLQRQKDELPANAGKDPGAVNVSRALLNRFTPEQISFGRSIQFGILANMGCLLLLASTALFRRS